MLFAKREPSDAQVVRHVLQGRKNDFEILVRRYLPSVQAVALAHTGNRADAQDAAQNAWLSAYLHLNELREPEKFGPWLLRIARNVATTLLRSRLREEKKLEAQAHADEAAVPDPARAEIRELLHREVLALDTDYREVLLLHYFAGKSVGELAALMDATPDAVKKRLQRARAALSKRLEDQLDELRERPRHSEVSAILAVVAAATAPWEGTVVPIAAATTATSGLWKAVAGAVLVLAAGGVGLFAFNNGRATEPEAQVAMAAPSEAPAASLPFPTPTSYASRQAEAEPAPTEAETEPADAESQTSEVSPGGPQVTGVVLDPDSKPVAGAVVWARGMGIFPVEETRQTTTDADGTFTLNVAKGTWMIRARHGAMGGGFGDSYGMSKLEDQNLHAEIHIAPRCVLTGQVLDAVTGAPVPQARLWIDEGLIITADAAGRYEYGGLSKQLHHLYPITPGYVREPLMLDTSLRDKARLDPRLNRGAGIRGTVVDESGRPVAGAMVWNPGSGHGIALGARCVKTDRQGRFVRDGFSLGAAVRLSASRDGFKEAEQEVQVPAQEGELAEVVFRLRPEDKGPAPAVPAMAVAATEARRNRVGVVHDATGNPVADARVQWGATDYEEVHRETRTDGEGKFRLENVPDRDGYLTVVAAGWAPAFPPVQAGAGSVVVKLEEGAMAHGTVTDPEGRPLAGVTVIPVIGSPDPRLCNPRWLRDRQATTDSEGRFELTALPRSNVQFDFLGPGLSEKRNVDLNLNGEDNRVTMTAGGAIRGKVVDAEGKPVRDFRVFINMPSSPEDRKKAQGFFAGYESIGISCTTDDGVFLVSDLVAGALHRVIAQAYNGGQATADPVEAHPVNALPPAEELVLKLGKPSPLLVQALADGEEEEPIPGAQVLVLDGAEYAQAFTWGYHDRSWVRMQKAFTNAEGWASFSVPFEVGAVIVRKPGYARERIPWKVEDAELAVRMTPECVLEGTVLGPGSRPLQECRVRLSCHADSFSTETDPDNGTFHIDELFAGYYTLSVTGANSQELHREDLELAPGQVKAINIDLP